MRRIRHLLVGTLVIALLSPLLASTLSCGANGAAAMAAMACCRARASRCMQGTGAGSASCCRSIHTPAPAALNAVNADASTVALVPVTRAMAVATLTPKWHPPVAPPTPTPPPIPLYALHASLLI